MSRIPFWQPGGRWQPPIVRIKGVDEKSLVGQQLMRAYEGTIRQFYLGAARAHALGTVDNSRSRKQFPDAQMTYTNMAGQEIVEIELRPEVIEKASEEPRRKHIPRYAILEVSVSEQPMTMHGSYLWRVRDATTPPGQLVDPISLYNPGNPRTAAILRGVDWDSEDGLARVAYATSGYSDVTQMVTRAAAWVDLSDFARSEAVATIELYGTVERSPLKTESQIGEILIAKTLSTDSGEAVDFFVDTIETGGGSRRPYINGSLVEDPPGSGVYTYKTVTWEEFFYHNPQYITRLAIEDSTSSGGAVFLGNGVWRVSYGAYQASFDGTSYTLEYLGDGRHVRDFKTPTAEGWEAEAVYNTDPVDIDVCGMVTDFEPIEGRVEHVSREDAIRPSGHPNLPFNGVESWSTAWATAEGERIVVPTLRAMTVPTYDVYQETVFRVENQVFGLEYLGDYTVYLPEYAISFVPAS